MVVGHMWSFRRWALAPAFSLEQYIQLQSDYLLGELT